MPRITSTQKTLAVSVPKLPLLADDTTPRTPDFGPAGEAPRTSLNFNPNNLLMSITQPLNNGQTASYELYWERGANNLCLPKHSLGDTNAVTIRSVFHGQGSSTNYSTVAADADTALYDLTDRNFRFDTDTEFSIRQLSLSQIPFLDSYTEGTPQPGPDVYAGGAVKSTLSQGQIMGMRINHTTDFSSRGQTITATYGFFADEYCILTVRVATLPLGQDPLP